VEDESYHQPVRTNDRPGDGAARGTARMEAFADAVFAIAFTLPVVSIHLPESGRGFADRLVDLWPAYLGYGLASLVIGIYWVQHHFSGPIYRTTGHYFNLATVLFLTAIGFIAFPARAFAERLQDPEARQTGAVFFVFGLCVTSLTWLIKWTVGRKSGHVDDRLEVSYVDRLNRRYRVSAAVTTAAAAIALFWWQAGLVVGMAALLTYMLPPETPKYRSIAPTVEGES
jgi:uncharacterized membrane protein